VLGSELPLASALLLWCLAVLLQLVIGLAGVVFL
jgi:hypothetical protein